MSQTNGLIYPIGSKVTSSLANLFSQSFSAKVTKSSQLEYDSKTYVAYGSQGKLLNSAAMVALFPREKIDNQVNFIKLKLIIFALLSFGLTTGIGRVLAIQFLEPVKDLGIGVKAIGKQDFRHRIPIKTADEFGKLGTVFNRAIESLGELEVAKIVQENLFPGENLNQNNLEVFGKSVSMTRLGGDYYDFFPIDKEKTGILMGDVAGHGVPAALIMSMAKASVLMSDTEKRNPAEMMSYLHKVIRSVKSKTIKRMMTCQYFYFDSVSGEFEFANAGHCFPLLIKNKGKTIEQLKLIGTPLGITKRARYTNEKAFMEPGDVMLLYTDGIIESKDSAGNDMGFDNFFELTKNAYSEKLEDFYQNLYNAYLNWSPIADDDITMVLIKLHKEETNG
jgi:HAMP domain-containing protein